VTSAVALAAACTGAAVLVLTAAGPHRAPRRPARSGADRLRANTRGGAPTGSGPRGARLAAGSVALAGWLLVGGALGVAVAGAALVLVPRLVSRLEPAAVRDRRRRIAEDLPLAADLMAACLAAGAAPETALSAAAGAVAGPVGEVLAGVATSLRLGADPRSAWGAFVLDDQVGPLARAAVRSLDGGTPLADAMRRCADDLRVRRRALADAAVRTVEVRSAGPLGLCFLPAFVLVGVVPTVVGLARTVLG